MEQQAEDMGLVQEEIHGVHCVAPKETEELIRDSLRELHNCLESNDIIPEDEKKAYRKSQTLESTYVNTDDFRLRFLRSRLFDVPKSARTMVEYLEQVEDLFGPYALERPIKLDDFGKDELKAFRLGFLQPLPFRDRVGRRIMIGFPNWTHYQVDVRYKLKVMLYNLYTMGTNDVDTQRRGVILILWAQGDFFHQLKPQHFNLLRTPLRKVTKSRPLRVCAVHYCSPDTPFFRFLHGILTNVIYNPTSTTAPYQADKFPRFRIHLGKPIELGYALQSYGISTDKIPITPTGTIKTHYFYQWMWIRHMIERGLDIIDCPRLHDVLFRMGAQSINDHPGNVRVVEQVRIRFEEHAEQLLLQKDEQSGSSCTTENDLSSSTDKTCKCKTIIDKFQLTDDLLDTLASDLINDMVANSGRLLVWFKNKGYGCVGWWIVEDDPDEVQLKVKKIVSSEFKKFVTSVTKKQRINKRKGSMNTSDRNNNRNVDREEQEKPGDGGVENDSNKRRPDRMSSLQDYLSLDAPTQQLLESDTSIFRSQDGATAMQCGIGCCKLSLTESDEE